MKKFPIGTMIKTSNGKFKVVPCPAEGQKGLYRHHNWVVSLDLWHYPNKDPFPFNLDCKHEVIETCSTHSVADEGVDEKLKRQRDNNLRELFGFN